MYLPDERRRSVDRLAVELFAGQHDHLMRVARWNCRRESDAADAVQEAFAALITQFDPGRGSPALAWLTLALKRICWRMNERRLIEVESEGLAEVLGAHRSDPGSRLGAREEAGRRLGALKRDERRAIVLHAAGYTYGEIGARCGWTQTKVNRCLYEGRRALRSSAA